MLDDNEHHTAAAYRDIIRLLILTGARRSEISDLDWQEINIDGRQLEIGQGAHESGRGAHHPAE